jgi:hypothetical protein
MQCLFINTEFNTTEFDLHNCTWCILGQASLCSILFCFAKLWILPQNIICVSHLAQSNTRGTDINRLNKRLFAYEQHKQAAAGFESIGSSYFAGRKLVLSGRVVHWLACQRVFFSRNSRNKSAPFFIDKFNPQNFPF